MYPLIVQLEFKFLKDSDIYSSNGYSLKRYVTLIAQDRVKWYIAAVSRLHQSLYYSRLS